MSNKYVFIETEVGKEIYSVISPNHVLPKLGQIIKVRYNLYEVVKCKEVIDYDTFSRNIIITIKEYDKGE